LAPTKRPVAGYMVHGSFAQAFEGGQDVWD
jgi:hypothetical protein